VSRIPSLNSTATKQARIATGTIDLLGFTHDWGRSRRGNWVIKRKTMTSRLSRSLRAVWTWCKANRHQPLAEQQMQLARKIRGHCAYYGLTGNGRALCAFRHWTYVNRR